MGISSGCRPCRGGRISSLKAGFFLKMGESPRDAYYEPIARWWQLKDFLFSPRKLGKMNPIWDNLFQSGWFNHQLGRNQGILEWEWYGNSMAGWVSHYWGVAGISLEMVTLGNLLRHPFLTHSDDGCLGCGKPSPNFLNRKPRLKNKKVYSPPKYLGLSWFTGYTPSN